MIRLRKSNERLHTVQGGQETWESFSSDGSADPVPGFRSLQSFREVSLAPGAEVQFEAGRDLEVLTYVWIGSLLMEDPGGTTVMLETGEFHRSAAKPGAIHRGTNGSLVEPARHFQFLITPDRKAGQPPAEKRRFPMAERRGILKLLGSRTGRDASLRLRQDVSVYSSILDSGHHLIHELAPERGAWLHVVNGRIQLVDHVLEAGDEAFLAEEAAVSLTARGPSEILLLDLI
jgi:redox-sensitive bicupin YhaK (pirin superfamily)